MLSASSRRLCSEKFRRGLKSFGTIESSAICCSGRSAEAWGNGEPVFFFVQTLPVVRAFLFCTAFRRTETCLLYTSTLWFSQIMSSDYPPPTLLFRMFLTVDPKIYSSYFTNTLHRMIIKVNKERLFLNILNCHFSKHIVIYLLFLHYSFKDMQTRTIYDRYSRFAF